METKASEVPGELASLALIRDVVTDAADTAGLDKSKRYRLILAVDEVATNIITHGYQEAGLTGSIFIEVSHSEDELNIRLRDQAVPYNPLDTPPPQDLNKPLEDRKVGGLGVFLVIGGVDDFRYEYDQGQNHNIFIMKRGA